MKSFQDLELSPELMRAVTELGYETPTPIQAETLPILLAEPTDFLGLAATGTGKTAAFSIPMIERIQPELRTVQSLILCPTRELAIQVCGQVTLLGKYKGIKAVPVYGGAAYSDQIRGIRQGASVVVGTPGRILDHIEKGTLRLDEIQIVILDEADEMISMGFKEDIETILSHVPAAQANTWLFSATMSRDVRKVADAYMTEPKQVQVNRAEVVPSTIDQIYYATSESNKPEVLCKLMDAAEDFYGLVFCQTKALVIDLTQYLKGRGYRVDCLHGDMDQNARERMMKQFRDRKVLVLICTDVASRGLDVKDVSHVVNYSLPRELDNYVHRIGRTARSGKAGFAFSLVTPSHRGLIHRIESVTKSKMREGKIPTRREIGQKKVLSSLTKFRAVAGHDRAVQLLGSEWKTALAEMSQEEIAGRFLTLIFPDVFSEQRDEVEQGEVRQERSDRGGRSYGGERGGYRGGERGYREERPRAPAPKPSANPARVIQPRQSHIQAKAEHQPLSLPESPWEGKKGGSYEKRPRPSFADHASGPKKSYDKKPYGTKKPFEQKPFERKPVKLAASAEKPLRRGHFTH